MSETTLYGWERPLSQDHIPIISNIDHTWVTNFLVEVDPVSQPTPPDWVPPESYWYCWGVAHKIASQALSSSGAMLSTANSISPSNVTSVPAGEKHYRPSSTSGAIVYYGLDGVCHNVANEILSATGTATSEPIRVTGVKGYPLSTFFYGTYGTNASGWLEIQNKYLQGIKLAGDDFVPFMEQFVPANLRDDLIKKRLEIQLSLVALRAKVAESNFDYYPELALLMVFALYEVNKLLGDNIFYQLFPGLDIEDKDWFRPSV